LDIWLSLEELFYIIYQVKSSLWKIDLHQEPMPSRKLIEESSLFPCVGDFILVDSLIA